MVRTNFWEGVANLYSESFVKGVNFESNSFGVSSLGGWDFILQGSLSLIDRYADVSGLNIYIVQVKE